jgi:hypothetical protein
LDRILRAIRVDVPGDSFYKVVSLVYKAGVGADVNPLFYGIPAIADNFYFHGFSYMTNKHHEPFSGRYGNWFCNAFSWCFYTFLFRWLHRSKTATQSKYKLHIFSYTLPVIPIAQVYS